MKTTGIYIQSDLLSQMSEDETVVLFQIFRITNSLEFWMRLHLLIPKERNKVFDFRNRMELYFALISIYKESIKEFDNHLATLLLDMNLSNDLKSRISQYTEWLSNWKKDEYLKVVDRIRNSLRFHLKPHIYKNYIKNGSESKDLLIGIADDKRYIDFLLTEPYTFEFLYIAEIVPDIPEKHKIDWIQERAIEETSKFLNLLREIIRELLKGHSYKKEIEI
ncbi:MAG: hypothetical protein A3C43_03300 [Candidatus Schekmanbacteria bacterium RIFCSPHIGHO2_02_FULL_38_11]|uniref:HEPN AbiU2-like domain-containing protein n=1 Tax=Candidatus Schekmanbacteria bacterium RIFCSPLOWO2_12_FULL_38_15 TaxID=1817883 RepID=A0A1F7SN77_9BACT|nr:MAG: hypothetical protein A3H37_07385 [Candidatus Schekmanbacteria bacterium RIFCSPLOWO2_02_FULL_38_14]OGL54303.1 MAG: hypothetical protein A3C43_03300 [Candidatus Schekmanbacteria bacterium RIFCSPHIGHO2_02_FULL_38_11]OGL55229.1 MAG: hypothetical protein A3G31_09680 [Candidatus Schekmanbacteria bacterium RIFCSPLOWO2_12_FULL_38_15]